MKIVEPSATLEWCTITPEYQIEVASFRIICDRGISHEIVRHRLVSYSQESTRYCNYGNEGEISVIRPPRLNKYQKEDWGMSCLEAEFQYLRLIESGQSPQIARSVLPTCLKTEIVMTCNFREWRHFLKLRLAKAAHPQIREIAEIIHKLLKEISPSCFTDI